MKHKDHIQPPSKSKNKEERLSRMEKEHKKLSDEYYESVKNLNGERYFDETIPKLAKKLKVDEETLRKAYENNKGELVEKFNKRAFANSEYTSISVLTGAMSTATGFFGWLTLSSDIHAFGVCFTLLLGTLATSIGFVGKKYRDQRKEIDAEYKSKVLEYKNRPQLPGPK